jgi:hypothetical protein
MGWSVLYLSIIWPSPWGIIPGASTPWHWGIGTHYTCLTCCHQSVSRHARNSRTGIPFHSTLLWLISCWHKAISGVPANDFTGPTWVVVCSIPQNNSAAPYSSPVAPPLLCLAVLFVQYRLSLSSDASSTLLPVSFNPILFNFRFAPVTKTMGLINQVKYNVLIWKAYARV